MSALLSLLGTGERTAESNIYGSSTSSIVLTYVIATAQILGVLLALLFLILARRLDGSRSWGRSYILPVYYPALIGAMLGFIGQLLIVILSEFCGDLFYFIVLDTVIMSLLCDGFIQYLIQTSISRRSVMHALLGMLVTALIGLAFGITSYHFPKYDYLLFAINCFLSCAYHIFLCYPFAPTSIFRPKRPSIKHFSLWISIYRFVWGITGLFFFIDEHVSNIRFTYFAYPFIIILGVLELPFVLIFAVVLRADTLYWTDGGKMHARRQKQQQKQQWRQHQQQQRQDHQTSQRDSSYDSRSLYSNLSFYQQLRAVQPREGIASESNQGLLGSSTQDYDVNSEISEQYNGTSDQYDGYEPPTLASMIDSVMSRVENQDNFQDVSTHLTQYLLQAHHPSLMLSSDDQVLSINPLLSSHLYDDIHSTENPSAGSMSLSDATDITSLPGAHPYSSTPSSLRGPHSLPSKTVRSNTLHSSSRPAMDKPLHNTSLTASSRGHPASTDHGSLQSITSTPESAQHPPPERFLEHFSPGSDRSTTFNQTVPVNMDLRQSTSIHVDIGDSADTNDPTTSLIQQGAYGHSDDSESGIQSRARRQCPSPSLSEARPAVAALSDVIPADTVLVNNHDIKVAESYFDSQQDDLTSASSRHGHGWHQSGQYMSDARKNNMGGGSSSSALNLAVKTLEDDFLVLGSLTNYFDHDEDRGRCCNTRFKNIITLGLYSFLHELFFMNYELDHGSSAVLERLELGMLADADDETILLVNDMMEENSKNLVHLTQLSLNSTQIGTGGFSKVYLGTISLRSSQEKVRQKHAVMVPPQAFIGIADTLSLCHQPHSVPLSVRHSVNEPPSRPRLPPPSTETEACHNKATHGLWSTQAYASHLLVATGILTDIFCYDNIRQYACMIQHIISGNGPIPIQDLSNQLLFLDSFAILLYTQHLTFILHQDSAVVPNVQRIPFQMAGFESGMVPRSAEHPQHSGGHCTDAATTSDITMRFLPQFAAHFLALFDNDHYAINFHNTLGRRAQDVSNPVMNIDEMELSLCMNQTDNLNTNNHNNRRVNITQPQMGQKPSQSLSQIVLTAMFGANQILSPPTSARIDDDGSSTINHLSYAHAGHLQIQQSPSKDSITLHIPSPSPSGPPPPGNVGGTAIPHESHILHNDEGIHTLKSGKSAPSTVSNSSGSCNSADNPWERQVSPPSNSHGNASWSSAAIPSHAFPKYRNYLVYILRFLSQGSVYFNIKDARVCLKPFPIGKPHPFFINEYRQRVLLPYHQKLSIEQRRDREELVSIVAQIQQMGGRHGQATTPTFGSVEWNEIIDGESGTRYLRLTLQNHPSLIGMLYTSGVESTLLSSLGLLPQSDSNGQDAAISGGGIPPSSRHNWNGEGKDLVNMAAASKKPYHSEPLSAMTATGSAGGYQVPMVFHTKADLIDIFALNTLESASLDPVLINTHANTPQSTSSSPIATHNQQSTHPVAIKYFLKLLTLEPEMAQAMSREVHLQCSLRHPNIIYCYGICVSPPAIATVSEMCTRGDLLLNIQHQRELRRRFQVIYMHCRLMIQLFHSSTNQQDGAIAALTSPEESGTKAGSQALPPLNTPLPPSFLILQQLHICRRKAALYTTQFWSLRTRLCRARDASASVAHVHAQRVLHRDIKTPNYLLGDDDLVKLSDFGLATILHEEARAIAMRYKQFMHSCSEGELPLQDLVTLSSAFQLYSSRCEGQSHWVDFSSISDLWKEIETSDGMKENIKLIMHDNFNSVEQHRLPQDAPLHTAASGSPLTRERLSSAPKGVRTNDVAPGSAYFLHSFKPTQPTEKETEGITYYDGNMWKAGAAHLESLYTALPGGNLDITPLNDDAFADPIGKYLHIVSIQGQRPIFPVYKIPVQLPFSSVPSTPTNDHDDLSTRLLGSDKKGRRFSSFSSSSSLSSSSSSSSAPSSSPTAQVDFHTTNIGSRIWLADEVKTGLYSYPADIFSLGVTLFEIINLAPPPENRIKDETVWQPWFRCDVPFYIRILVMACVDPRPECRPTAEQITQVLALFIYLIDTTQTAGVHHLPYIGA